MATATGPRKSVSIYDYPEHLNPFREEDSHNKIRFWTLGKKVTRSNSITFSGIKDLRNSWALKSFMKKGKKGQSSAQDKSSKPIVNGENSPILYRRALQYSSASTVYGEGERSTVIGSPARYVYGGSVTPLPRSRFQERLRSPSHNEVNYLRAGTLDRASASPHLDTMSVQSELGRSDVTGSRLSVESVNPFDGGPVAPVRASRRKKKRAPPPPPTLTTDTTVKTTVNTSGASENNLGEEKMIGVDRDVVIVHPSLTVELKIVEDEDAKAIPEAAITDNKAQDTDIVMANNTNPEEPSKELEKPKLTEMNKNLSSKDDDNDVKFPKVDIRKYRRNSSFNEDDVQLRRGNLEDFNTSANYKRSKSLSFTGNNHVTYDINLNATEEMTDDTDANGNEKPMKVVCKLYDETRKRSIDNSMSSTEKEFIEIDKATRELEREINKLNSALKEDEILSESPRLSVSEIKRKFDRQADVTAPNPIPKPRRSNLGSTSPVNGNAKLP